MKQGLQVFSLEEANGLIPQIAAQIECLMTKKALYDRRHDELFMHELISDVEQANNLPESSLDGLERDCLSLEEDLLDLKREMEKITRLGCLIHDIESGRVDIPGRREGKLVYFCWKFGEDSIGFYHCCDTRTPERLPL